MRQISGNIGGLLIGQPQVGHAGVSPEAMGVLEPIEDPGSAGLAAQTDQVGSLLSLQVLARGRCHHGIRLDLVAAEATHRGHEFFTPDGVARHGNVGQFDLLAGGKEIVGDAADLLIGPGL